MKAVKKRPKTKKRSFQWKPGKRFSISAPVAGAALESIRRQHGNLTPELVVREAAHPDSPLHRAFTWDDTEAAERWRQHQARYLLHSIRVVVEGGEQQVCYVNVVVKESDDRGYLPAAVVMGDPDYRDQALTEAIAGLEGWKRRYGHLEELAEVLAAADRVIHRIASKPKEPQDKVNK